MSQGAGVEKCFFCWPWGGADPEPTPAPTPETAEEGEEKTEEEYTGPVRSLEERIGSQKFAEYQVRIQDSLKAVSQGQYVTARTKDEADAIQQFTTNPELDLATVQGSPATRHKIGRMQSGFREAQAQIQARTQELYQLSEADRVSELEEDRLETVYQLWEEKTP